MTMETGGTAEELNCPHCGMAVSEGDNPTERDGATYCCGACASDDECTCAKHQH